MEALAQNTYTMEKPLRERVIEILKELEMNKAELALRMNFSRSAVSQYLNGKYNSNPEALEEKLTEFVKEYEEHVKSETGEVSKLRTDCYVNDSTGVLQQVVSSLLCTYKIMIRWVPKHMKDTGDLFSKICDMDNLRKAHKNAKRGKGWYAEVKCIEKDLDHYLKRLQENLIEHRYHTSEYEIFTKKESNKEREIYKLPFYPDRIYQWAILQVIEPYLLNSMTKDTYSAIPNRGIQPIINQLRGYKKKIKKDGKVVTEKWIPSILVSDPEATKYCLKLDVRKYYPSIVHDVLKAKYRELFKDEELIWLMDEIIDSISTCPATEENIEILQRLGVAVNIIIDDNGREFVDGVGIPIGNYVSQYDGNFNLSVVDHWLKEVKGVKYYFRYMDDMVIFGSSKEELHKLKRELDEFMAVNLKQVLKHNWQVFPTKVRGVDFVGYRFFGEYTLLRKSTCKTFKRRMLSISSKRENNVSPTYSEWCSFNSYVGWLQHCDSFRLYQKYVEPNVEYMHNYYLKEVKGNAEICKCKNYSGERKAS